MSKFSAGAFLFVHSAGLEPRDPAETIELAKAHGLPEEIVPAYAGDRAALMRALQRTAVGIARDGYLLRPIKRTNDEVVYGIVKERRDEAELKLDHHHDATVSWSEEPDPSLVIGDHPVARRVCDAYAALRGKIVADDWSATLVSRFLTLGAAPMRADGRVYWVPPQRIDDIRKLGTFLSKVGIDLVLCEIEPETRTVVEKVAQTNLDEELDRLEAEAKAFDGKQKPSTYTRRLEEYQQLRERAGLYRDALGIGVDRAKTVLAELERKVEALLDVRKQTVVHREPKATEIVTAPSRRPALVWQGVRFEETCESNGETIFRAVIRTGLDDMLLSTLSRPLTVGTGRIHAERAGAEEAVELMLTGVLAECAAGLRGLGIEVA